LGFFDQAVIEINGRTHGKPLGDPSRFTSASTQRRDASAPHLPWAPKIIEIARRPPITTLSLDPDLLALAKQEETP
jgi:hypothetical protein